MWLIWSLAGRRPVWQALRVGLDQDTKHNPVCCPQHSLNLLSRVLSEYSVWIQSYWISLGRCWCYNLNNLGRACLLFIFSFFPSHLWVGSLPEPSGSFPYYKVPDQGSVMEFSHSLRGLTLRLVYSWHGMAWHGRTKTSPCQSGFHVDQWTVERLHTTFIIVCVVAVIVGVRNYDLMCTDLDDPEERYAGLFLQAWHATRWFMLIRKYSVRVSTCERALVCLVCCKKWSHFALSIYCPCSSHGYCALHRLIACASTLHARN